MQINMSVFDSMLKIKYQPPMQDQHNTATVWMSRITRTGDHIDATGKFAEQPILMAWPQGQGARAEGQPLPPKVTSNYQTSRISVMTNLIRIGFSRKVMEASRNDAGAFAKAAAQEMENQMVAWKRELNRQWLTGFGVGSVGTIDPASNLTVGSTVITVDDTRALYRGARYEIWNGAVPGGGTNDFLGGAIVTIASVDNRTQVTLAAPGLPFAISVGDTFIRELNKDNEMMGLPGIIDDGTNVNVFQGINRTTNPEWKGFIVDAVGAPIDEDLLQRAFSNREEAGYSKGNLILLSYKQRDALAKIYKAAKEFHNTVDLAGGFTGISYNGAILFPDGQCSDTDIWLPAEQLFTIHEFSNLKWVDVDGRIIRNVPGFDDYEAYAAWDANQGCSRNNASSAIKNLS